jgi:GxxExxY protein
MNYDKVLTWMVWGEEKNDIAPQESLQTALEYFHMGYGFLEKVYENALCLALQSMGLKVQQQARIEVYFQNSLVGEYFADLLVEDAVLVELKAAQSIAKEHEAQLLNYLRATPYEVGLLLNFGPKPEFIRKVFDNHRKTITWENV